MCGHLASDPRIDVNFCDQTALESVISARDASLVVSNFFKAGDSKRSRDLLVVTAADLQQIYRLKKIQG
jgi:hypothetical protein